MKTSNTEPPTPNFEGAAARQLALPAKPGSCVYVGGIALVRLENGQLWMMHRRGEGAVVSEEKLAKVLEEFFWREF